MEKVYLLIDEYLTDTSNIEITVYKDLNSLKAEFDEKLKLEQECFDERYDEFEYNWSDNEPSESYIYRHNNLANTNIYVEEKEIL